ncbi:MAG: class I SAM-dependent methyltransferase [Melioribacteraceae bacterium]|nr:class I SAM-dependent methyltransferase [Melioribacteraceae bacterium]
MPNKNHKTNFQAAKEYVKFGLKTQANGKIESPCGPGSSLTAANQTIRFINRILKKYKVESILDLGCGDWNWMQHVQLNYRTGRLFSKGLIHQVNYFGWDASEELIKTNKEKHGNANVRFEEKDIVTEEYPNVDLVICRDVLFHLDIELGEKVVKKILNSGAKYFLSTSFPKTKQNGSIKKYNYIDNWGYYPINLDIAPFSLAPFKTKSLYEKSQNRYMFLYDLK